MRIVMAVSAAGLAFAAEATAQTAAREDIYLFRTHMAERILGQAPGCAAAGFAVRQMDTYDLYSVAVDTDSGLITDAEAAPAPGFTACIGAIDETGGFDMHVTGAVADQDYTSLVRCQIMAGGTPVEGLAVLSCRGMLDGLRAPYSSGVVTSSTLAPAGGGAEIPGYVSTSIVTMRLWRAPD